MFDVPFNQGIPSVRMSPLASFFALALLAVCPVACSSETDPAENDDQAQGAQSATDAQSEQGEEDDVQADVTESKLGPRAACGTYCTRTNYGAIACNIPTSTGKTSYTCKPLYGASYNTGCVTNRGASYGLPYF